MRKQWNSQLQGDAEFQSLINLRIFRQIDLRKTFQVLQSAQMQIQPLAWESQICFVSGQELESCSP